MSSRNDNNAILEGVKIFKPNFAGKEDKYNRKGARNFLVYLDDGVAAAMAKDDWVVKLLPARVNDEGEDLPEQYFLKVWVRYGDFPPQIYVRTSRNTTQIYEDDVAMLDAANIVNVDLIVNKSKWTWNGDTGVKTYLKSMYVTIEEDYLQQKYAEMDSIRDRNEQADRVED